MAMVNCVRCGKFIGNVTDMPDMFQQATNLGKRHESECKAPVKYKKKDPNASWSLPK